MNLMIQKHLLVGALVMQLELYDIILDPRNLIPQLNIKVSVQLSQLKNIKNPFYSLNLMKYLDKVWWKTIVLWSNLVPAVRNRTRCTTATVEVENNIVKNLDIGKKNLQIDQYIHARTQTLNLRRILLQKY